MNDLSHFLAFASSARHGSFARAARELGLTASTVAKRILRLEQQLGVKLFHRTTRQVTLTSDGEALFARCEALLAQLDELQALAAGTGGQARGELRINVPITYGKRVVMPAVAALLERFPDVTAEVRLSDEFCDLVRDGIDAAVRISPLADSRLAARRIDEQQLALVASPAYLERAGRPRHPSALDGHRFIVFRNPTSGRDRPLQFDVDGAIEEFRPPHRVLLNDGEGMVEAARLGLGLAQVPDYMAADALGRGELVEVLQRHRPPPLPVSIVWPGNRLMPPRVRAFIEALTEEAGRRR